MGASLSAAQTFFDLFDRVPTIDNGSTEGLVLVRKLEVKYVLFVMHFCSN